MIDKLGLVLLGLSSLMVLAIGAFIRFVPPEGATVYSFLFGGKGLLELILSAGAFVVGSTGVYFLFRRARHDDRTIELSQFKEAASLLGASSGAANGTGIFMLRTLARNSPRDYMRVAAVTFSNYATEKTGTEWDAHYTYLSKAGTTFPSLVRSSRTVRTAITSLGSLRKAGDLVWPNSRTGGRNNVAVGQFTLCQITLIGMNFSRVEFTNLILSNIAFQDCDFTECRFHARSDGPVVFTNCDLTGAKLEVTKARKGVSVGTIVVKTENCRTRNATFFQSSVPPTGSL